MRLLHAVAFYVALFCANQRNYFKNAIAGSENTLKTRVATQL